MRFTIIAGVMALAACKHKAPPRPEVAEVRVLHKGADLEGAPALDLGRLTEIARTTIASTSGLVVHEAGGGAARQRYRLRVDVEIGAAIDETANRGNLRALLSCRLSPMGEGSALPFEQSVLAERAFDPKKPGEPAWQAHAERAVRDCVGGVGARVKLSAKDSAAIVAALAGADEDLRDEAVRLAAERHERAAVPSLIKELASEDHALRDRAIGALAAIGDARAVRPLTEVAKFNELAELPKILDALATIGGPEARAYLEFVASGHESPEIRELAHTALGHLQQRQAVAEQRPDLRSR